MRPRVILSELSGPRNLTVSSFSITARSFWIVLDLLAVCLDLCTPLIEEGIAHVHSGAGMNRGSFAECGMRNVE
jgi:hypothetical protein